MVHVFENLIMMLYAYQNKNLIVPDSASPFWKGKINYEDWVSKRETIPPNGQVGMNLGKGQGRRIGNILGNIWMFPKIMVPPNHPF